MNRVLLLVLFTCKRKGTMRVEKIYFDNIVDANIAARQLQCPKIHGHVQVTASVIDRVNIDNDVNPVHINNG